MSDQPRRKAKGAPQKSPVNLEEQASAPRSPTPTDRLEDSHERHVESLSRERDQILGELRRYQQREETHGAQIRVLGERLTDTQQRLARAEERLRGVSSFSLTATVLGAAGATAVSGASFAGTWSAVVLWCGITAIVSGIIVQACVSYSSWR